MSQNSPPSFSSKVECPRRNRLASGAASELLAREAGPGKGAAGEASAGLSNMKRQRTLGISRQPTVWGVTGLRKLPSRNCGDSA